MYTFGEKFMLWCVLTFIFAALSNWAMGACIGLFFTPIVSEMLKK